MQQIEMNRKLQKENLDLQEDLRIKEDELTKCKKKLIEKQNELASVKGVLETQTKLSNDISKAEKKTDSNVQTLLDKSREENNSFHKALR
jgi:predicted  nucleic acid-binding Zn-ribbon protein